MGPGAEAGTTLFGFTIQTATYAQTQLPDLAARRARVLQIRSP
jgi:hypothetical protein